MLQCYTLMSNIDVTILHIDAAVLHTDTLLKLWSTYPHLFAKVLHYISVPSLKAETEISPV